MTTNELILVKLSSYHRINQMFSCTKYNVFSVIVYCFLLKAQCVLDYYLKISKISNDFFIISTQEFKKYVLNIPSWLDVLNLNENV